MSQQAIGQKSQAGQVDQLTATRTLLAAATMHLYKDDFIPTEESTLADFAAHEANFTGYADAVETWSAVGVNANGDAEILGSRAFFQATDNVTPNNVGGAWVQSGAMAPVLEGYYPFPVPVPVPGALSFVGVTPKWGVAGPVSADVES